MAQEHIWLASTNPRAGREDDLNGWYDQYHVREIVNNMSGFKAGQRYRLSAAQRASARACPWKYLAVYELEGDDIDAVHASNAHGHEAGLYTPADGLIAEGHRGDVYTPVSEPVRAPQWPGRDAASDIFVVRSSPAPGREDDYNDWYENHVREVLANVAGYRGAQRYRLNASQRPGQEPSRWEYCVLYDIETDDLVAVHASMDRVAADGAFTPQNGVLKDDYIGHAFSPCAPRYVGQL